ncbi:MAG: mechanosensitive ion channel [Chitinophagaceae bacterium]|nr:mechanosensitive ion channel [Chitinophagaceae bacterium]MEA3425337.1 mechanosensitive ion channel [Bacteroidota bacterium]MCA6453724.1 mechanosensitive ion channel [Chitinophagaceae bacterium]MCA6455041.1 mechanosensitive ion channel [Chitinophagaceae bacterium]MCA6458879.1 mechanosensitive ion channel [Chitinophagaceae bacterium]
MENLLQQKILDNTIESYLYVLGTILLILLIKRLISKYLAKLLYKIVAKAAKNIARQSFLDLVVQPLDVFLVLIISIITLDKLKFPSALDFTIYHITFKQLIDSLATTTLIIVFIWLCLRVIEFIAMILEEKANLTKDQTDNQLIVFFKDFFKVIMVIIGILLILRFSFNKNIGNLLTGLSIVGAAVALATRESMENLIASFIIFFDKPFITGDLVKVNNFTGNIEKIGLRSTRIRTTDKTFISVPNKQMVDTIVDNITLRTQRKAELRLEISLSATAQQLRILLPAVRTVLQKPEIEHTIVYLMDTGKTAHIIAVDYFTSMQQSIEEFNSLREAVNLELIELLEKSGVELAAANTDVIVRSK